MTNTVLTGLNHQTINNTPAFEFLFDGDNVFVAAHAEVIASGTGLGAIAIDGNNTGNHYVEVHGQVLSFEANAVYLGQPGVTSSGENRVVVGEDGSITSASNDAIALNGEQNLVSIAGLVHGESNGVVSSSNEQRVDISATGYVSSKDGAAIYFTGGNGRHIVNNAGSVFSSSFDGISLADESSVTNTGSVSAERHGVHVESGGVIDNSGSISAGDHAVDMADGGNTLFNSGTIAATGSEASTTLAAVGVRAEEGANQVTNSGDIGGEDWGIRFEIGLASSNVDYDKLANTGTISGETGVLVETAYFTGVNDGLIAADLDGVVIAGTGGNFLNNHKIVAGLNGIENGTGAAPSVDSVIENNGDIIASTGIRDISSGSVISNNGHIATEFHGIYSTGNFISLRNTGTITNESAEAMRIDGDDGIISNSGSLNTSDGRAIFANGGNTQISNSGEIVSADGGIESAGDDSIIVNTGRIDAEQDGIYINSDNTTGGNLVVNEGTITSSDGDGIYIRGEGNEHVVNRGLIVTQRPFASENAIYITGGAGETSRIVNEGTLQSFDIAVRTTSGDDTLINAGSIIGRVQLGDGADVFDGRGGTVTGTVNGEGGDDVYIISDSAIQLVEIDGNGEDTVQTTVSYALEDHFETLVLIGDADIDGTGTNFQNTMTGNAGDNDLFGHGSRDTIDGGLGDDTVDGGRGDDVLNGSSGDDWLAGRAGVDIMDGGEDDDHLFGGVGDDIMSGGDGNDTLKGGLGADQMEGGAGTDTFVFCKEADSLAGTPDVISDFVVGEDVLDFSNLIDGTLEINILGGYNGSGNAQIRTSEGGGNTTVRVDYDGDGSTDMRIELAGVTGLTESEFIL